MPGECLNTGTTAWELVPFANASESRPTRNVLLNPNVRACRYMNEAVESATATGARFTLIEDACMPAALEDPCCVTRSTLLAIPMRSA